VCWDGKMMLPTTAVYLACFSSDSCQYACASAGYRGGWNAPGTGIVSYRNTKLLLTCQGGVCASFARFVGE